ncbi:dienelactone hydrolase [Sphingomonas kyeonggiensis]|uniref:alpha/beta hydrolase n=1 Tax=Sphingomonas kyeonggiensis TaxID=1268553 RepID=UPI0027878858|nr:alpha/beta hydrolase [Sphingomonas kyeonggiensis]MDQ0250028.1 dienelactone hydrolase [Sphingomonas kyeonggiensis]
MRGTAVAALALLALSACHPKPANVPKEARAISAEPVTLTAADGVKVAGIHVGTERPKALILLFHQAESGKDEYATIAPRLATWGYESLRIDQRAGGDLFGGNETAKGIGVQPGHVATSAEYLAAKPDLEAALAWARARKLPVILWGSSYSASLAFLLAAEQPDAVKAVMAFSPGEYFDDKKLVETAAAKVKAPVFVTSAQDGHEIDAARTILAAVPGKDKEQFVPKQGGVHGSSTLLRPKNKDGAEPAWAAVIAFLQKVAP